MQLHQIDLVPGESIRVGRLTLTLVSVEGNIAQLHVDDPDNNSGWIDPIYLTGCDLLEPALV